MTTEKQKYLNSVAAKKEQGLRDVKFFPKPRFDATEESVYAELNRMDIYPDIEDKEVLGSRSPV